MQENELCGKCGYKEVYCRQRSGFYDEKTSLEQGSQRNSNATQDF